MLTFRTKNGLCFDVLTSSSLHLTQLGANWWQRVLLLGVFLLFLSLGTHAEEKDESITSTFVNGNTGETISIEREEELWSLVLDWMNKRRSLKSVNIPEVKRWEKLLSDKTPSEQRLMWRMQIEIKIQNFPDQPELLKYRGMEEVIVTGYQQYQFDQFKFVGLDPSDFSVLDIAYLRDIRKDVNDLYSEGRYDEAYPILLELAKRGFKDSQSRLAYILFTGTEDVQKSNLRALGWLGVAASGDTEPAFRKLFSRYTRQVPNHARAIVNEAVGKYVEAYGFPEHISCSTNHRFKDGPVKRTYCQFKLESISNACFPNDCWANKVNREDG